MIRTPDSNSIPHANHDSGWKDILDVYFPEFMAFFFPKIAAEIDWAAGFETLDKELQTITTGNMMGKRLVDKLIKAKTLKGEERWFLFHIEVQGEKEKSFECRLFEYYYRLYDRYHKPIITIVVLADGNPKWRPERHKVSMWGYEIITFRFFTTKLLDYRYKQEMLNQTENPFGIVVLAYLASMTTRKNIKQRFARKFVLTRRLYERNLTRDNILNLYKFIDYVLSLPEELEIKYNECIYQLEEERAVSYVTSAERIGIKKGFEQGIQQGMQQGECNILLSLLQHKFHEVPETYRNQLAQADAKKLLAWGKRIIDAATLKDVFVEV